MNVLYPVMSSFKRILVVGLLLMSLPVFAADAAAIIPPDKLIANLFNEMNHRIQNDEAKIAEDKTHLAVIGDEVLVPYVSFETMAKQILGKNWRKITPDQRKRYTLAFKERVSSSIVSQYDPAKQYQLEITGFRTNDAGDRAAVTSDVTEKLTGRKYQISYKLYADSKTKRWQVYDVAMDGVSVLQSFKSASAEDFKRNGIEFMIAQLTKAPEQDATVSQTQQ